MIRIRVIIIRVIIIRVIIISVIIISVIIWGWAPREGRHSKKNELNSEMWEKGVCDI